MRHEQALRARSLERLDGLVQREVPTRLAVELAPEQGRLADEQVGVARRLDQLLRGCGVARVCEQGAVRLHPKRVRLERVVRNPGRRDGERADRERRVGLVLRELERPLEHVGEPEALAELGQELGSAWLYPERRVRLGPFVAR